MGSIDAYLITDPINGSVIRTANGNIIDSNLVASGIDLDGDNNKVTRNAIGTDFKGEINLGNPQPGIRISGSNNVIGGNQEDGNIIAFNAGGGIFISSQLVLDTDDTSNDRPSTGNSILSNSIHSNYYKASYDFQNTGYEYSPGIELSSGNPITDLYSEDEGLDKIDKLDKDKGSNNGQNFPTITKISNNLETTTIKGRLVSEADKFYKIQFFSSGEPPEGGFSADYPPQGKNFLGQTTIVTDKDGKAQFEVAYPLVPSNELITATATDPEGNTSEFSWREKPLEFLAKDTAYKSLPSGTEVEIGAETYTVDTEFAGPDTGDSRGFYAVGLVSEDNPPVLAVRGTEPKFPFDDVWADVNPQGVGFKQFEGNKEPVLQWLRNISRDESKNPLLEQPDITAHSLGGALAQLITAEFVRRGGSLGELETFNSPGIDDQQVVGFDPSKVEKITHNIVNGDFVSLAGEEYLRGKYLLYSKDEEDTDFGGKHLEPVIANSVWYDNPIIPGVKETKRDPLLYPELQPFEDLSSPSFGYDDRGFLKLRHVLANEGKVPSLRENGRALAVVLGSREKAEETRKFIGENLDQIDGAYKILTGVVEGVGNALEETRDSIVQAASDFADTVSNLAGEVKDAAIDAINNAWKEDAWEKITKWGSNSIIPSVASKAITNLISGGQAQSRSNTRSLALDTSSTTEDELTGNSDDSEFTTDNPALLAMSTWPVEAWEATKSWSTVAWQATSQWTPEHWQETKNWTPEEWTKTSKLTDEQWKSSAPGGDFPVFTLSPEGSLVTKSEERPTPITPPVDPGITPPVIPSNPEDPGSTPDNNPGSSLSITSEQALNSKNLMQFTTTEGEYKYTFFDEEYYLKNNPDVADFVKKGKVESGLLHFLQWGQLDGNRVFRLLKLDFDESSYLENNRDVAEAINEKTFTTGLQHFLKHGKKENRLPDVKLQAVEQSIAFDDAYYLNSYPDVAALVQQGIYKNGAEHFIDKGRSEKRNFRTIVDDKVYQELFFDESYYLSQNSGVTAEIKDNKFRNAIQHFFKIGRFQGLKIGKLEVISG